MTILLVCPNEMRMSRLKGAIHSAGFHTISARGLDDAWARTDFFDVGAVLIDHELKNDIAASAFRQRFITLNLNEDAAPEAVVMMEQVHLTTTELATRLGMTVKDAWDLRRGIASPNPKRIAELAPLLQVTELQLQEAIDEQKQSAAEKAWD